MTNESGVQIDLIGTLKRRAYIASVIAGAITLFVYWIAMALPNEYTASAVLLVEPQTVSGKLIEPGASGIDLNERLNLMTSQILSRTRLSKIIEELQLFEKESQTMTRQEIVDEMRAKISVRPVIPELTRGLRNKKVIEINTFEVFFSSSSAVTAAQVAQSLANDFIQNHIAARVESTQTSLEFISAEESRLSTRIREIDAELAEIKEENESSLPENLGTTQRNMERDLSAMRYAQRQLDVARSDLSFWEHQYRTAQALGQSLNGQDSLSPARRIQGLELQLKELLARGFTERHPDMISLKAELASNRRGINEARAAKKEDNEDLVLQSFGEQNADAERQRSMLNVGALEQEVERISLHLDELRAYVVATPRVAEKMEAFERQRVQLAASLKGFSSLRLEAAVQADLERRQLGERFRILESAFPPRKISSPNRGLILLLGLLFGLTIGVVVGLVAEGTDPSFHQERDLQSSVGIPVLAVIPSISFDEDLDRQRRTYSMRAMAMVGVTAFSLFGGFGTYVFVNGAPSWLSELIDLGSSDEGRKAADDAEAFRHRVTAPIA